MAVYRARRAAGTLKPDPVQELAVEKLQSLHRSLVGYQPSIPVRVSKSWFSKFGLDSTTPVQKPSRPRGLYIYGGVGRGKSMLMDLFFEQAPLTRKRRVHFHAFMQEVHDRLHGLRAQKLEDPLLVLATAMANDAVLLCFDEFQVTDIADAMILGRFFDALFKAGVVVVATSNRAPDALYQDGLHRDRFLPFIAVMKAELEILELDNGRDYRLARLMARPTYYTPNDAQAERALNEIFAELTDDTRAEPMTFEVKKRPLLVPRQALRVAWFSFADLCGQPLGPADYLAIAARFDSVIVADIPMLGPERRDEAKRFNTMIDAFYEAKVHFIASAAAAPSDLYPEGVGAFEFQRTVSRLMEMQSVDYVANRRTQP